MGKKEGEDSGLLRPVRRRTLREAASTAGGTAQIGGGGAGRKERAPLPSTPEQEGGFTERREEVRKSRESARGAVASGELELDEDGEVGGGWLCLRVRR